MANKPVNGRHLIPEAFYFSPFFFVGDRTGCLAVFLKHPLFLPVIVEFLDINKISRTRKVYTSA